MNWGKGIAIFLVLFIVFITTLAVILMRTDADLVAEDYYLQEIKYGDEITAQQNAKDEGIVLEKELKEDGLYLRLTTALEIDEIKLKLFRPDNPKKDVLKTVRGKTFYLPMDQLSQGSYRLTIDWVIDEKAFQLRDEIWVK